MHVSRPTAAAVLFLAAACANSAPPADSPGSSAGQVATQPIVALECRPSERMPVAGRASPYDSVTVQVGARQLRICYGRPRANSREIFGGLVPYDRLWRTGANEPTIVHLPFAAEIGGMRVEPGSYSLYTVPGRTEWVLVVNRSTTQWGHESSYTPEVEAQEVGRVTVATERLDEHVENFTIRSVPTAGGADILLEWERTLVRIPVRAVSSD